MTLATSANVAPLPDPRAAAIARNATVPTCSSSGWVAAIAGPDGDDAVPDRQHRDRAERSESQPPTGRMSTATTTKPAIRLAASAGVSA